MNNNQYLQHYGIKGMKWGVRRTYVRDIYRRGKKIHSKGDPAERSGIGVRTHLTFHADTPQKNTNQQKKIDPDQTVKKGTNWVAKAATSLLLLGAVDQIYTDGVGRKLIGKGASFVAKKIRQTFDGGINIGNGARFYQK